MEWTADVSAGDWLRDRLDDPWRGTMHDFVPHGFDAYARVFHPAHRDRPVGRAWPPFPYYSNTAAWQEFEAARPEVDEERVSWATTAEAFGTTMHGAAKWPRIVGRGQRSGEDGLLDAAGWRYHDPSEGDLDATVLAAIAPHLGAHTTTPDDGCIAIWEGWGGLVGAMGHAPSRALLTGVIGVEAPRRHEDFLARSSPDVFNSVFRKPSWQPGVLSDDVSRGPRLRLPDRNHVLFRGGIAELADPEWPLRAPWRDRAHENHGFPSTAQSPSIVWPDDHAWVLVTEIDFDSTIVAGTPQLIRAIVSDPRIEAAPVRDRTSLQWNSDDLNR